MPQRFAIYYAPDVNDALWDRASIWLGRDAETSALIEGGVAGIERTRLLNLTQSAGRYGFHATIKSPMALADGMSEEHIRAELEAFASVAAPVDLGLVQIADLHGFLALVPQMQSDALQDFAALVVEHFEPFRAPLDARQRAARADGLSERQLELLDAYGYPYVFDQFRFHMTLTDRLAAEDRDELQQAAQTWFGPILGETILLDRLVLYHEPESGKPFRRLADFPLKG
jgi:putative phosphonate metabolism protein